MAVKPPKAAAPAMDDDDDTGMGADDGNQGTDDEEGEPSDDGDEDQGDDDGDEGDQVLLTVLKGADGSYILVHGDEDDGDEEGGDGAEGDEGAAGEGGEGDEGEEGAGNAEGSNRQVFHTEGELLKGVLDCIREDKGAGADAGDQDFEGGYNEEASPAPSAAPSAGKMSPGY